MKRLIDIHNHLIPKFDDGPRSMEESITMLQQAESQGITDVFATSHFPEYISDATEIDYFGKLQNLREESLARGIGVNIYSGAEIFYHRQMEYTVRSSKVGTLGGFGQYVLLEFPMFQMPNNVEEVLFNLSVNNYIPIVAHPARYKSLTSQPNRALDFVQYGGLLQLNGGSILGHFGKEAQKLALSFLDQRIIHFIASDAHSPVGRGFVLDEVYEFLKDRYPSSYLEEIFQ
jgi:protein-tyrosine phosphatase